MSQQKEKSFFFRYLSNLCDLIVEPKHQKGRKPRPTRDIIFAIVLREYLGTSTRRLQSDLNLCAKSGYITSEIPFTTLLDHMQRVDLKNILKHLIEISSLPLKNLETEFAIDGTGFSTSRYETYFSIKHIRKENWKQSLKAHVVCGVESNIITAIEITGGRVHDNTMFETLARDTRRNFKIKHFYADKGYTCAKNYEIISELGGRAFIPFRKNATGRGASNNRSLYKTNLKFYNECREEFMRDYGKRENIESVFSTIKRRFGNNIKCKNAMPQTNELLARALCYNLCILVRKVFSDGICVDFDKLARNHIARK
jgi:transposase